MSTELNGTTTDELREEAAPELHMLEHEHREIARGIDRIGELAPQVGRVTTANLSAELRAVLDWIRRVLAPHADWEDAWLYPEIDRLAGTPWATRLMRFEHQEIRTATAELEEAWRHLRGEPGLEELSILRGQVYRLEGMIRAHFEKEERFLVPLLEEKEAARPGSHGQ